MGGIVCKRALVFETDLEVAGSLVVLGLLRNATSDVSRITFVVKVDVVHG